MFFILSKIFGLVVQPVNVLVLLELFGLFLFFTPFVRLARAIAVAAALVLAILCFSPVGSLMLRALEDRFAQPPAGQAAPTGIIVLGGSIDPNVSVSRGQPTLNEAAARLTAGVALARAFPEARLVFTGGASDLRQKGIDEAQAVRRLWLSLGVPEARMTFENASRNTQENATMTLALVKPQKGEIWFLLTSAAHMPRSVGVFRRAGWRVVPYPVDYRTFGDERDFRPTGNALRALQRGRHRRARMGRPGRLPPDEQDRRSLSRPLNDHA